MWAHNFVYKRQREVFQGHPVHFVAVRLHPKLYVCVCVCINMLTLISVTVSLSLFLPLSWNIASLEAYICIHTLSLAGCGFSAWRCQCLCVMSMCANLATNTFFIQLYSPASQPFSMFTFIWILFSFSSLVRSFCMVGHAEHTHTLTCIYL